MLDIEKAVPYFETIRFRQTFGDHRVVGSVCKQGDYYAPEGTPMWKALFDFWNHSCVGGPPIADWFLVFFEPAEPFGEPISLEG